ncbi:hypothetical protein SERLADRAFT_405880 [Serpula lacrymans var. lacrymans S7.9]|uniref:Uncharacterized protein n=1 Tax=Serpula lacrymans var. lacrymans (strain S7.9) TaxID=578457 RepID=F8NJQ4_SERL9|nr:uncharacterized protein SERLADRAFT_405880 [Serpula lacrymans var. lacrymans S7.9]EGO28269.1 hypothetical protein SERLADRAFT_405880 [Serpula lacrymans var. lacrymans S7.9]
MTSHVFWEKWEFWQILTLSDNIQFSKQTRKEESCHYLQTLSGLTVALSTGACLSLDTTFKSVGKATVTDKKSSQKLGVAPPNMIIADNCCYICIAILSVFPGVHIGLNVLHFIMRYLASVLNGIKNPLCSVVAQEVSNAVLKTEASKNGQMAEYRDKFEQEVLLQRMFEKWAEKGGVWSEAASKVHADQLAHVKKGCLSRMRQDIRSDGSQIEGSHNGMELTNEVLFKWSQNSENAGTFGGLFQIKAEDPNLEDNSIFDPPKCNDNLEPKYVLASMNIDLALLFLPQAPEASSLFTLDNNATTSVMQIGPPKCKVTFCDLTGDDALASEGPTVKRGRLLSPYLPAEHQQAGTKRIQDGQMVLKGKEQTSHVDSNDQPEIIPKTNVFTSTNHDQHIISKTNVFTSTNQTSSKAIQGNQALNPIDKFFTSQKDNEFYLFMDMHLEQKWTLFGMTSRKWVQATKDYYAQLEGLNKSIGQQPYKRSLAPCLKNSVTLRLS